MEVVTLIYMRSKFRASSNAAHCRALANESRALMGEIATLLNGILDGNSAQHRPVLQVSAQFWQTQSKLCARERIN
jgi:hypothetical protein